MNNKERMLIIPSRTLLGVGAPPRRVEIAIDELWQEEEQDELETAETVELPLVPSEDDEDTDVIEIEPYRASSNYWHAAW